MTRGRGRGADAVETSCENFMPGGKERLLLRAVGGSDGPVERRQAHENKCGDEGEDAARVERGACGRMSAPGAASRGSREGRAAAVAVAARSPRRSSLFWWLFDNHDELIGAKGQSRLGLSWKAMCPVFAELNLSLGADAPITPAGARQTWWRVRKEKARLRALEAEAEAERLMGREHDPRGTAPSRISGRYEPPLAEASPQRSDAPISRPPSVTLAATVRPGDASEPPMIEMFEGEPLDLNFFIVPGVAEPWDDPEYGPEVRFRIKGEMLRMRFENWKRERVSDPYNRVDRARRRINDLRNK